MTKGFEDTPEKEKEGLKILTYKYSHFKKLVVFMMYTVRKVRNLSKSKDMFGNI